MGVLVAQIVLSQAGAAAGASLLPQGLTVFGQTVAGAAIGRAVGNIAGRVIDASLASAAEGPRVKSLTVMESREGAGIPSVFGRMRVGGQVIWASRFRETRKERSAGKGGPKIAEYAYSVSFAVALCRGPITRVDRIWANGEPVDLAGVNWRLYNGDDSQMPDPLIEAVEGPGQVPAYRGIAYVVFEDLPLDAFGNRLPQLSFEVVRAGEVRPDSLRQTVQGVNIIPASGEFVYSTEVVRERRFPGIERALNMNNGDGRADFLLSIDQLNSDLPLVRAAALTVAWFGDDVQAGSCKIRPGVETQDRATVPYGWSVDGTGRNSAHLISQTDGNANFGGTPADTSVLEGITAMKAAGLSVTLSPFLLMDSAGFPWRGRIGVSSDGTAQTRSEIDAFVGDDGGFGFRHFILHHARLAVQAGGVEAILIGSEMIGLTRVRDATGAFPFVEALVAIAAEVRAIVGAAVKISYAADWTEYGAYVPSDGSGDVLFPLDTLWASSDVDFVGVDWYPPVGDWRDGNLHTDAVAGYSAPDDPAYLFANMAGGEAFDWYYANQTDRDAQVRTPIVDTAHGEDWVFRAKDLAGWWNAAHHERPDGIRSPGATAWIAGSKPVRLCEIGYPAIDRGGNAPNLFYDPKSAESAIPPYSSGARDDLFQRRAISVALAFWQGQSLVEEALVWAWDGRPWPHYPVRSDIWSDGENWQFGHWLNGRSGLIELSEIVEALASDAGVPVDVQGLNGFVEGFAVDGVTGLRQALAPLVAAYGIICIEREGVLVVHQEGQGLISSVQNVRLLESTANWTHTALDKVPGRLVLNYVSGAGVYEPAIAEARHEGGDRSYAIHLNLPLVMGEARATQIASDLLARIVTAQSGNVALGPEGLAFEPGDRVQFADGFVWQVSGLNDDGLVRQLALVPDTGAVDLVRFSELGDQIAPALVRAAPELVLIDGPDLPGHQTGVPLIGVAAEPWPGRVNVVAGPDLTVLRDRARIDTPTEIGQLISALPAGPLGRWDHASVLDVILPGADLASLSTLAVLNGAGLLLVQGDAGWELLAYQSAELVGEDHWQLSGLLRGLQGSQTSGATSGAVVIIVASGLIEASFASEEQGLPLLWAANQGQPVSFTYDNLSGLPWRVGHLRATPLPRGWQVNWTRRGRDIANNWTAPEALNDGLFKVELRVGGVVVEEQQVAIAAFTTATSADEVRVAEIGSDGRVGAWASIPLIAAYV